MKNFLIVFALVTLAAVIAACEQKTAEPAGDAAAKTPDAAATAAPDAGTPQIDVVQPAEAPIAEAGPAAVGPAVVTLPAAEPAIGPVAEPAK